MSGDPATTLCETCRKAGRRTFGYTYCGHPAVPSMTDQPLQLHTPEDLMSAMKRWVCPTCGGGRLAPSRPRMKDVRRWCLPCSDKSGWMVERIAPALTAKRDKARARTQTKACRKRAKKRASRPQEALNTRFHCGVYAVSVMIWNRDPKMRIQVAPAAKPRRARVQKGLVTVYDHGGDPYDARAAVCLGELRWRLAAREPRLATSALLRRYMAGILTPILGARPRLPDYGARGADEIAGLLRARDAVNALGHNVTTLRRTG